MFLKKRVHSSYRQYYGSVNGPEGILIHKGTDTGDINFELSMDENPLPARTLTVYTAGTGAGTITSSPPGIDCGTDCWEEYALKTIVT